MSRILLSLLSAKPYLTGFDDFRRLQTRFLAVMSLLFLTAALSYNASAQTTLVDDDGLGSMADCNDSTPTSSTIQSAISGATPGTTVSVCPGTYTEVGQIFIDKDLTIIGADKTTTIIKPAQDTGDPSSGDARGWFLTVPGITFNMSGVTLDGIGRNICFGIYDYSLGTIQDINVMNIGCSQYYGRGIYLKNNATVRNVRFENIERIGVFVWLGATAAVIDGNTYVGKGPGDHLDYAIELGNGGVATITNNTISNNTGVASDGSDSAGIFASTLFGPGTQATITGNTITGNTTAIYVGSCVAIGDPSGCTGPDTSLVEAHFNRITGNGTGVLTKAPLVNAENNWWGCNYGPGAGGAGCVGTANGTIGTVDADPWLTLRTSATPNAVSAGGMSSISSNLNFNSDNVDTSGSGSVPNGTPASFTATLGTVSPTSGTTTSGVTGTTFTAGAAPGTGGAQTTIDGQTVNAPITIIGPSAATVSIGGRLLTATGQPVVKAMVILTDTGGTIRNAISNGFGYYRFDDVTVGETYIVSASSKRYTFTPMVISPTDDINELNLIAEPLKSSTTHFERRGIFPRLFY